VKVAEGRRAAVRPSFANDGASRPSCRRSSLTCYDGSGTCYSGGMCYSGGSGNGDGLTRGGRLNAMIATLYSVVCRPTARAGCLQPVNQHGNREGCFVIDVIAKEERDQVHRMLSGGVESHSGAGEKHSRGPRKLVNFAL